MGCLLNNLVQSLGTRSSWTFCGHQHRSGWGEHYEDSVLNSKPILIRCFSGKFPGVSSLKELQRFFDVNAVDIW